jgi:hypothetical protein
MSSAAPSSWGSVDGIQLRNSASVGAAAGNRASDHVEGSAVGFQFVLCSINQFIRRNKRERASWAARSLVRCSL